MIDINREVRNSGRIIDPWKRVNSARLDFLYLFVHLNLNIDEF